MRGGEVWKAARVSLDVCVPFVWRSALWMQVLCRVYMRGLREGGGRAGLERNAGERNEKMEVNTGHLEEREG